LKFEIAWTGHPGRFLSSSIPIVETDDLSVVWASSRRLNSGEKLHDTLLIFFLRDVSLLRRDETP
jgi:hypothetical protein